MSYPESQGGAQVLLGDDALATFTQRLAAVVIDGVACGILLGLVLTVVPIRYELVALLGLVVVYFGAFEGMPRGQTPGKSLLRIRVISYDTGQPIGPARAAVRAVGRIISGLPLDLGFLWMLWDAERQTWHDMMARSVVVTVAAKPFTTIS